MNNTTMDQNMELEMMIGYDEERKAYECYRCGCRLKHRKFYNSKQAFLRHLQTKRHLTYKVDEYPHVVPIFKEVIGYKDAVLDDFMHTDPMMVKIFLGAYKQGKEKKYAEYLGLTVDELDRLVAMSGLAHLYTKAEYVDDVIKKVKPYRQALKNITKESNVMCKDVMGIVADYI